MTSIERAQTDADAARARLRDTAERLRARVTPRRLAIDAADEARLRGQRAVDRTVAKAAANPAAVALIAVGVAAWITRRPLARLLGRGRKATRPRPRR